MWISLVQIISGERPFTTTSRSALDVSIMAIILAVPLIFTLIGVGVFAEALHIPNAILSTTETSETAPVMVVVHPAGTQSIAQLDAK